MARHLRFHRPGLLVRVFLCLLPAAPLVAAEALQSHGSIRETARQFVAANHPWQGMDTSVRADELDDRTRLPRCARTLRAFLPPGGRITHRTTIGVRCEDSRSWTIYVPVSVTAYARALVARRPLPPGTVITDADVQVSRRDVASLGYGYISSLGGNGYRTRLSVAQGAVITPVMVESAVMVRRGQRVRLQSAQGAISVSMAGEALADASLGSRVQVRNLSSGKVVEGIVRSSETVEIGL